jgi:hypothetical protein
VGDIVVWHKRGDASSSDVLNRLGSTLGRAGGLLLVVAGFPETVIFFVANSMGDDEALLSTTYPFGAAIATLLF